MNFSVDWAKFVDRSERMVEEFNFNFSILQVLFHNSCDSSLLLNWPQTFSYGRLSIFLTLPRRHIPQPDLHLSPITSQRAFRAKPSRSERTSQLQHIPYSFSHSASIILRLTTMSVIASAICETLPRSRDFCGHRDKNPRQSTPC
jgi:hypothetical protein